MKRPIFYLFALILFVWVKESDAQDYHINSDSLIKHADLIFKENFSHTLDTSIWHVELEHSPGSYVGSEHHKLILKTGAGVTVWLKKKLSGDIIITYDRKIIVNDGPFDRLSDLNQFWMASDPHQANLFTRGGQLDEYNNLQLYYVGMGGNSNTTTRFRRYDGLGNRELIAEYKDESHLLQANKTYHIKITVKNKQVSYWVNDLLYFSLEDPRPLNAGFFGFRSTKSNQEVSKLKIYQLR
jgi:rhamnogalacturonan endolyase